MDVKTIICPNCGATTSNFHNCEYCGSFLVQKASMGEDMSEYVKATHKYDSTGLISVFKKMVDLCQKYPNEARYINLCFYTDGVEFLHVDWLEKGYGITVSIIAGELENNGIFSRFLNSNVIDVFSVSKNAYVGDEGVSDVYDAYFGYDYKGAAILIAQLLDDVYSYIFDKNTITMKINIGIGQHDALYNLNGIFLGGHGDGENEFKNVEQAFIDNNDPDIQLQWEAEHSLPEDNEEHNKNGSGAFVSIVLILAIIFFIFVVFFL